MTNWLRELGPVERDGSNILLTREQWERLTEYDSIAQPTSPSVGRCWRTKGGHFCWVVPDPKHPDGSYVLIKALPALVVDEAVA